MENNKFAGKKIYIVDDEEEARELICGSLTKNGFKCFTASSGDEALENITKIKPDAIIMDLDMPYTNGLVVMQKLKEREDTKDIPIAVLTCLDTVDNRRRCSELNAGKFLVKPISEDRLVFEIKMLLIQKQIDK